ncbi:MAG: hypothetical protein AAGH88_00535 [Planctomycetota bacterium]
MMIRTLTTLALTCFVLLGLTGCNYSQDRHDYTSTFVEPTTVYVLDVASQEVVWSYPVPPEHRLVVEFETYDNFDLATMPETNPTSLYYELLPIDAPKSWFRAKHYRAVSPLDKGTFELQGRAVNIGSSIGDPIDPAAFPADRPIEEIERDLEQGEGDLPEPDAPDQAPTEEGDEAEAPAE